MSLDDDRVVDVFERFRTEEAEVVANPPPVEGLFLLPVADPHDVPQRAMLFGQVLQFVVVEVASQPHGGQHDDRPVVHAGPPLFAAGVPVDIRRDLPENVITGLRLTVEMLECAENRDDLITAVGIEWYVVDHCAVQSLLAVEGFSHRACSSKIVAWLLEIPAYSTRRARKRSHLRGAFFRKSPKKRPQKAFSDGH